MLPRHLGVARARQILKVEQNRDDMEDEADDLCPEESSSSKTPGRTPWANASRQRDCHEDDQYQPASKRQCRIAGNGAASSSMTAGTRTSGGTIPTRKPKDGSDLSAWAARTTSRCPEAGQAEEVQA